MSAVRVNEARVLATGGGADWWATFQHVHASTGRIVTVTTSLGGDLVDVACDNPADAAWLADHMRGQGMPTSAVTVTR